MTFNTQMVASCSLVETYYSDALCVCLVLIWKVETGKFLMEEVRDLEV